MDFNSQQRAAAGTPNPEDGGDIENPLRDTESTRTVIQDFNRLRTDDIGDPTPGPSHSRSNLGGPSEDGNRKRNATGAPPGNAPKKGKPNIPPEAEKLYKQARNSRSRAARYLANETMLMKYVNHSEHITPANIRVRNAPPFGGDDPQVRREWSRIIQETEKSMVS